jgi:transcriptional regulator with XRE-family HTH domain
MEAQDYVLALKKHGLTQVQIAEGSGLQQAQISKIECGVVADVLSKSYRALKDFYDKTVTTPDRRKVDLESAGVDGLKLVDRRVKA